MKQLFFIICTLCLTQFRSVFGEIYNITGQCPSLTDLKVDERFAGTYVSYDLLAFKQYRRGLL